MIDEFFFKFFLYSVFHLFQQLKCPDECKLFFFLFHKNLQVYEMKAFVNRNLNLARVCSQQNRYLAPSFVKFVLVN